MLIENKEYKVIFVKDDDLALNNMNIIKENIANELNSGNLNIALDLKELNSITSSGLGVLIGIQNKIKTMNGTMKIINVSERIMNIFQITKLNLVFDINI